MRLKQALMQPLMYVLIKCSRGPGMLHAVYAHVAGHLQKCHLSSFYGWENSITEHRIKTPMITYRLQAEQVWIQVCTGPGRGAVLRWHTYCSKVLPELGITLTVLISQVLKVFQQLCIINKKTLLLPGWNYLTWEKTKKINLKLG